jgi:bacteriocin biosynthesis cyclodehydratase domain-containing protein
MTFRVVVVSVGPFGVAVQHRLHGLRGDAVSMTAEALLGGASAAAGSMVVLATWRKCNALCLALEAWCQQARAPFLPVTQDTGGLLVGPLALPGKEGCYHCFLQRTRGVSEHAALLDVVSDWYDAHPEDGPHGYLEPFALIAAARVSQIIDAVRLDAAAGGELWRLGYIHRDVTVSRVVGVHDCPRCGLRRPAATRSFEEMTRALDAAGFWRVAADGMPS